MVYLLKCAKENTPCEYNLGEILARSLHNVVGRNATDFTPIYAGAIATLVFKYIKDERRYGDDMGTLVEKSKLLDFTLMTNMSMSVPCGGIHLYTYLGVNGQQVSIRLPRTNLFLQEHRKVDCGGRATAGGSTSSTNVWVPTPRDATIPRHGRVPIWLSPR